MANVTHQLSESTKRLKHDFKNHLNCISTLVDNNELQNAQSLIKDIYKHIDTLGFEISTGNKIVDAILNEKQQLAKAKGIAFTFKSALPSDSFLPAFDICTIFSNACDNAIEACERLTNKEKHISITAIAQGKQLLLSIENPIAAKPIINVGVTNENSGIFEKNIAHIRKIL